MSQQRITDEGWKDLLDPQPTVHLVKLMRRAAKFSDGSVLAVRTDNLFGLIWTVEGTVWLRLEKKLSEKISKAAFALILSWFTNGDTHAATDPVRLGAGEAVGRSNSAGEGVGETVLWSAR